ncbi:hypothetical protein NC652_034365 [Populus alba x Populus x berolinensis]|nr:hypothetical protein NC652_034365 [Populus alba x Populus x berolinensis]
MLFPSFCSWILNPVLVFFFDSLGGKQASATRDHNEGILYFNFFSRKLLQLRKLVGFNWFILLQSVTFEQFRIQAGSDSTGVATDMISVNSTVRMTYRNKGTFFGVHVTSTPMDLSYSEITLVPGSIKKFYQSRKSQRLQATGN